MGRIIRRDVCLMLVAAAWLTAIDRAIELNRRDGRFHFLKGLAEQALGRMDAARSSFQEAKRVGLHSEAKLDYIRSLVGYNSH